MSARSKIFLIGLPLLVATLIVATFLTIFGYISLVKDDPHWLNRGGALLAACSAGAIFLQIMHEVNIERRRAKAESASLEEPKASCPSWDMDKVTELKDNSIKRLVSGLSRERLQIAAIVVLCAFGGELLHGFGDLLLEMCFPDDFGH